jgi:hypothetical protein
VSPVELIDIAIGCTLVALGVTSVGAWGLRRRGAEPLPLLFGIWCVMYGFRLIARVPMARLALGGGEGAWAGAIAFTTYCINVPSALFFEALIGRGWLTDAQNRQGEFFDRERVDRWLTSATSGNVTRLGAEALSDLRRWRGDVVFEDDVTFVIAQFTRLVMTNDSIATARRHGTVLGAAPETL